MIGAFWETVESFFFFSLRAERCGWGWTTRLNAGLTGVWRFVTFRLFPVTLPLLLNNNFNTTQHTHRQHSGNKR